MKAVRGSFFDGKSARPVRVSVLLIGDRLQLRRGSEAGVHDIYFKTNEVELDFSLGTAAMRLSFPGGEVFEPDVGQAEAEELIRRIRKPGIFELSFARPQALIVLCLLALVGVGVLLSGLNLLSGQVAQGLPQGYLEWLDERVLTSLSDSLGETELGADRLRPLHEAFARIEAEYPELDLRLRVSGAHGVANAFCLPGGTIVVTDSLIKLSQSREELLAVLAHEVGHVNHRHGVTNLIRTQGLGILLSVMMNQSMNGFMETLLFNSYSQEHELEADLFAAAFLDKVGESRDHLIAILGALHSESGDATSVSEHLGLLSTHPSFKKREANIRNFQSSEELDH